MVYSERLTGSFPPGERVKRGRYGSSATQSGISAYVLETKDSTTSPGPPYVQVNNFDKNDHTFNPARVSGYTIWYPGRDWFEYEYRGWAFNASNLNRSRPSNQQTLVNAALANINPDDRPLAAPVFLWELRELPRALRDLGRYLQNPRSVATPTGVADNYLAWKFGWGPLLGDLHMFGQLIEETLKRHRALSESDRRKRVKGSLPNNSLTWRGLPHKHNQDSKTWITGYDLYEFEERNWFTANYEADLSGIPVLDTSKLAQLRWALSLDSVKAKDLWNMIPWSWLVDYAFALGNLIEATSNSVAYRATNMCIMSHGKFTPSFQLSGWSDTYQAKPVITGGSKWESKRRFAIPYPAALPTFDPYLSKGQYRILTALSVSPVASFSKGG